MEEERAIRAAADGMEIANLQGRYIYYLEGHRCEDVVGLFCRHAPDVSVEIGDGGVYVGRDKVEALFLDVLRPFFTQPGILPLHMLTTPVIEIDSEAGLAHGRWLTIDCNSFPDERGLCAVWQQGTYDNLYAREDGQWRILRMRWLANLRTRFDRGWVSEPVYRLAPLDPTKLPERAPYPKATTPPRCASYPNNHLKKRGFGAAPSPISGDR